LSFTFFASFITVHPRSHGERMTGADFAIELHGSSPLARGEGTVSGRSFISPRFIPARTGRGSAHRFSFITQPVHPRSHGERPPPPRRRSPSPGSSPLARGEGHGGLRGRATRRFIPARTGRGHAPPSAASPATVHPRSHGERGS